MSGRPGSKRQVHFGEFQLDLDTAELRNNGTRSSLVGQPLQILTVLLERPGELVTREELKKKLWPGDTFVDFDQSLNKAVNRLREALKDSAESPRFIETLPRRGYRFVGLLSTPKPPSVEEATVSLVDVRETIAGKQAATSSKWRRVFVLTFAGLVCGAIALVFGFARQPTPPQVVGITRLTNDGWRKYALICDGLRLYFSERGTIFQASVDGGETTELVTGLSELELYDISPRGSELLVSGGVQGSPTVERHIWIVSVPSGSTHQVGEIKALWASWAPDGEHVGYATNDGIYLANREGTDIRKVANVPGTPWKMQFSPDGKRIRFDAPDREPNLPSIWEVETNGKGMRVLFPELDRPLHTGAWTSDGKYFFFNSHQPEKDRDEDVWVSIEPVQPGLGRRPNPSAERLTNGPIAFGYPVPSTDGERVYALGTQSRAELERYDRLSKQFVPYLKGISASAAEVSRDGQWVAYVSFPELALWTCRLDGTERMQLTSGSVQVETLQWSPDGTRIAFADVEPGKPWRIYVIPASGGKAEELMPEDQTAEIDPSWSADGNSIVFGRPVTTANGNIQLIDLKTHRVSTIPGSLGLFGPRLSPDGRYLAASPADSSKLMLYDLRTEQWKASGEGTFQFLNWARNSKTIYGLSLGRGNEIARFDVERQSFGRVVNLQHVEQGSRGWVGLAEDESPLIVVDKSVSDVYQLALKYR
jgi:DNA-binding winged helix-turn-helix (wHTH) protein/Tol biopolymer transport system component